MRHDLGSCCKINCSALIGNRNTPSPAQGMQNTSFQTISRHLHRQSIAIFGSLALVLVLSGLLVVGAQRVIEQERRRLTVDFQTTVAYIREQERFLQQLHTQNGRFHLATTEHSSTRNENEAVSFTMHSGESLVAQSLQQAYSAIGHHMAEVYASFWAVSYYPASFLLLVNKNNNISLRIPAIDPNNLSESIDRAVQQQAINEVRQNKILRTTVPAAKPVPGNPYVPKVTVRWLPLDNHPQRMLSIVPAGFPAGISPEMTLQSSGLYLAMLMNKRRLSAPGNSSPLLEHRFWLTHADQGLLMGQGPLPVVDSDGYTFTTNGLVLRLHSQPDKWTGYYQVGYNKVFEDNIWMPISGLVLFILSVLGGINYARWYKNSVIEPAQKAQDEILESEMFNRTLIATAPVALCLLTRQHGHIVFASHLAQDWLGLRPDSRFPPLRDADTQRRQILDAQSPGVIKQLDWGNHLNLHVAYAPTRYNKQDVVLCAFTDVTVRVQEQHALERAKAAADEANKAKTSFLATMSHEIRTPLYGVLGTLELLSLTRLDEQQQQHVKRIQHASELLLQQISDILDVSKIEAGQLQLEITTFSPRELVQHCTSIYAAMAEQKKLLLFCTIDTDISENVQGDAVHIQQILMNLISNAIKFTEAGQVIVRLHVEQKTDQLSTLIFQVTDSGIGIAHDKMADLFAPFYLIEPSKHTIRGAGLGLSICDRLAQLMSSQIDVISEPGLGSSFSLKLELAHTLPKLNQTPDLGGLQVRVRSPHPELSQHICRWLSSWGADAQPATAILPTPGGDHWLVDILMPSGDCPPGWSKQYVNVSPQDGISFHPEIDGHSVDSIARGLQHAAGKPPLLPTPLLSETHQLNLKVLIAEDNPINQATLSDQLEQLGCRVSVAQDGKEALMLWGISPYDIVLTDVNMPHMNGYELTQALRTLEVSSPIIGVTANAMLDEKQRCMQSGMDAWLVKPIDLHKLYTLLSTLRPDAIVTAQSIASLSAQSGLAITPVPERYRQIFQKTMRKDLEEFKQGLDERNTLLLTQKLHRMRGALAVIENLALSERLGTMHDQLVENGWTDNTQKNLLLVYTILKKMVGDT